MRKRNIEKRNKDYKKKAKERPEIESVKKDRKWKERPQIESKKKGEERKKENIKAIDRK